MERGAEEALGGCLALPDPLLAGRGGGDAHGALPLHPQGGRRAPLHRDELCRPRRAGVCAHVEAGGDGEVAPHPVHPLPEGGRRHLLCRRGAREGCPAAGGRQYV